MSVLPTHTFVHHVSVWYPDPLGQDLTSGYEQSCESWELSPGPLQEQELLNQ